MKVRGNGIGTVAGITGGSSRDTFVHLSDLRKTFIQAEIKGSTVRRATGTTNLELSVAVGTKTTLMTAITALRIVTGSNRVSYMKITAVDIDHVVAESTHFISAARLVTIQTVILLMTSGTIERVPLGKGSVVKCPDRTMSLQAGEFDLFDEVLVMTINTDTCRWRD